MLVPGFMCGTANLRSTTTQACLGRRGKVGMSSLGQSKHSENVGPERALHIVQVDILNGLAHDLLTGVVHENVQPAILVDMLLDHVLGILAVHQVGGYAEAFPPVSLDSLFDTVRTALSTVILGVGKKRRLTLPALLGGRRWSRLRLRERTSERRNDRYPSLHQSQWPSSPRACRYPHTDGQSYTLPVEKSIGIAHFFQVRLAVVVPAFQLGELCQRLHVHIFAREGLLLRRDARELLEISARSRMLRLLV